MQLVDVAHRHQAHQPAFAVHQQQLFDFGFVENPLRFIERCLRPCGDKIFLGHHIADPAVVIFLKLQIATGQNSHQSGRPAIALGANSRRHTVRCSGVRIDDGNAADVVFPHRLPRLPDGRAGRQRDGIDDHTVLAAFHLLHLAGLIGDGEIFVNKTNPPFLCECDRQR